MLCMGLVVATLLVASEQGDRADPSSEPIVLSVGTVVPSDSPWAEEGRRWKVGIQARSKGRLKGKLLFSRPNEAELADLCMKGDSIAMYGGSVTPWVRYFPALAVIELPYIFESSAMAEFVLSHYVFERVRAMMRQAGLELWRFSQVGWHGYGSTKAPITSPSDLVGRRIRAHPGGMSARTLKLFGAIPVELDTADVFNALNDGVIESVAHAPLWFLSSGWVQHIRHYSHTRHRYHAGIYVYCKGVMWRVPADLHGVLLADRLAHAQLGRTAVHEMESELLALLKTRGVSVSGLTDAARRHFLHRARSIRTRYMEEAPPQVQSLLKQIRAGKREFRRRQDSL